jgi:glycine/D-amino acid oxidase-like deaminating enzyme
MTLSYWQRLAGVRKDRPAGFTPRYKSYDIVVIGAGLVGIATAYYLRQFGCDRVLVLEKEFIGYGASGRNAGFLLSGMAEPYSRLLIGMGADSAREIFSSTIENHDLIARAVSDNKVNCGYKRSGSYHLAATEVERGELEESVNLLKRDGFDAEYLPTMQGAAGSRLKDYLGGYYSPVDGRIDPFAFVKGLARNIEVIEGFKVQQMKKTNAAVELIGEKGKIRSAMVVLATNGYVPLLESYFENLVFPVRGQMLATLPLADNLLGESIYYANFGYDYFSQLSDYTILMGGLRNRFIQQEIGYDDSLNPDLQNGLEDYIRDDLGIEAFRVDTRWSGVMGNTIDGLPLVGSLPRNSAVLAAVGFNTHGFGVGMAVARDLANAIMKNETSDILRRFSLKRFQ